MTREAARLLAAIQRQYDRELDRIAAVTDTERGRTCALLAQVRETPGIDMADVAEALQISRNACWKRLARCAETHPEHRGGG